MQGAADACFQQLRLLRLPQHDSDNLLSGGGGRQEEREEKNVMSRKSFPPSSVHPHPHLDLSDRNSRSCSHNSPSNSRSDRRTDSRRPILSLTPCIPSSSPSSESLHPMLCPLLLLILLILSHVTSAHPISRHHRPSSPSSADSSPPDTRTTTTCHGMQPHTLYHYSFRTHMILNNNDQKGKEPVGFGFEAAFDLENVWQNESAFLLKVSFAHNDVGHFVPRSPDSRHHSPDYHKKAADARDSYPLYALIKTSSASGAELENEVEDKTEELQQQTVHAFFLHNREDANRANVKKSIVSLTRVHLLDAGNHVHWRRVDDQRVKRTFEWRNSGSASSAASILKPEIRNIWQEDSILDSEQDIVQSSTGWQNVTLRSRIYTDAHSHMSLTYELKLTGKTESPATSATEESLDRVIRSLGEEWVEESGSGLLLQRERSPVCHDCRSFASLTRDYEDYLKDEESASMQTAIAYLKILNGLRHQGSGTSAQDILSILQSYEKSEKFDVIASLLDILAGARTETTITAALDFLNLQHNENLDIAERFLSVLPASYVTAATSLPTDWSPASGVKGSAFFDVSSQRFVVQELLRILDREGDWASVKLRWSTFQTLAALTKTYNRLLLRHPSDRKDEEDGDLSQKVMLLIKRELKSCGDDEDCHIALITAFGNTGDLSSSISVLEKYALDTKSRRPAIAAMKALQECLEEQQQLSVHVHNPSLNDTMITRLRNLSLMIVYDHKHETTSRIIACEIIAKHLSDSESSQRLLKFLSEFGNNEMVTLMWKRALMRAATDTSLNRNWYAQSTLFNGTSSAFSRSMGGTETMNATYGVSMELLSGGSVLKESSFDFLLGDQKEQQHIVSVGLFTRGLSSFAGDSGSSSDNDEDEEEEEETMRGGIALKIMGMSLRPYTLFAGKGSLFSHIWSGTASSPMTVYRGNLLLSDHEDSVPLINGFILRQRMAGVTSVDLSGSIQVSLWSRTSDSKVSCKLSALMQGSQAIGTGADSETSVTQLFAFGGATSVDTLTNVHFSSDPKMCVKMQHPEQFTLRHNTRKYEQVDSESVKQRIHRRNFQVNAQSYGLHPKIQEVCEA